MTGVRSGPLFCLQWPKGTVDTAPRAFKSYFGITQESKRSLALRERLVRGLREKFPDLKTNSHPDFFLPHALSLTFVGVDLGKIQGGLSHLAMSSGSACGSGELAGSPVLRAIGLTEKEAQSTLRVSVGRWTTEAQVDFIIESFSKAMQTA